MKNGRLGKGIVLQNPANVKELRMFLTQIYRKKLLNLSGKFHTVNLLEMTTNCTFNRCDSYFVSRDDFFPLNIFPYRQSRMVRKQIPAIPLGY